MESRNCLICNKIFVRRNRKDRANTFCSRSCGAVMANKINRKIGIKNPNWKGGKHRLNTGYIVIRIKNKYELEHRIVMEKFLKRKLKYKEQVHHINNIKDDNRIDNLILFKNNSEHMKFHGLTNPWAKKYLKCISCGKNTIKHNAKGYCILCYAKNKRYRRILLHSV